MRVIIFSRVELCQTLQDTLLVWLLAIPSSAVGLFYSNATG